MAVVRVLEEDPELAERVAPAEIPAASAAALARLETLGLGSWSEPDDPSRYRDGYGMLVLEGVLARRVDLNRFECTEILGEGDLLRPWVFGGLEGLTVPSEITWNVLEPVRLAILDRRFATAVSQWPEVTASLMDRLVQRARWLAFQLAVCHLVRVDMRLLVMLWHFAERWGRVTRDGVIVRLPVTHSTLASVVGARRPSVTTAIGRLQEDGRVVRLEDGDWLLRGGPPAEFVRLHATEESQEPKVA